MNPNPAPEDLAALAAAWNDAGPNPATHYAEKARFVERWPTLANAIEAIVNPSPLKPRLALDARSVIARTIRERDRRDNAA